MPWPFLEGHVGVQLLHCTTRLIKLSKAGERYAASCRRMLTDLQEADMQGRREIGPARHTTLTGPAELKNVLYTAKTHTSGGRDGASRSIDGPLDAKLSHPGGPGSGTNPEQLFAAGWSACFMSSMQLVAGRMKVALPADRGIEAEVDLGPVGDPYQLAVRLNVSLPDIGHLV